MIEILDISNIPTHLLQNGRYVLDPGEFQIRMSKSVSELTDIDKIKDEAATGGDLPYSLVNDLALGRYKNHNILDNNYSFREVEVWDRSVKHNLDRLYVLGVNDENKTYNIELRRGDNHWLSIARTTFLNELDLGEFVFTEANVTDNFTNGAEYTDGTVGVAFIPIHFGAWFRTDQTVTEDLRPLIHALYIFQSAFCDIGWNFSCPALETPHGRRWACYLLKEDYGTNEDLLMLREFRATGTSTTPPNGQMIFTGEIFDYGGHYNPVTGFYTGPGVHTFNVSGFIFHVNTASLYFSGTIEIRKENAGGTISILGSQSFDIASNTQESIDIYIQTEKTTVLPGEKVFINISLSAALDGIVALNWSNKTFKTYYVEGDTIPIAENIHPDYTLLDFMKGITHLLKGKVITDWATKTVSILTPYDVDFYGDVAGGFFEDTIEDLTDRVLCDSKQVAVEEVKRKRFYELEFKKSTDKYIEQLDLVEPLHGMFVDLGNQYEPETVRSQNPFFEPTANAEANDMPRATAAAPDIPYMWDNTDGELSYKIGPRILYLHGEVEQAQDTGVGNTDRGWNFKGTDLDVIPYGFQKPGSQILVSTVLTDIDERLIYGDDEENGNDLWRLVWRKEIIEDLFTVRTSFDVLMSVHQYKAENFRGVKEVFYDGRTTLYRPVELNDFNSEDGKGELIMKPIPRFSDCVDQVPIPPVCKNFPAITLTPDVPGNAVTATADDTNIASPIDTDTWDYSNDGGDTWIPYTPGTPQGGTGLIFRRITTYTDGCPETEVTVTYHISSNCRNNATIDIIHIKGLNSVAATGTEDFNSVVNTDTWTVSIDGAPAVPYTPGTTIEDFTSVEFTRIVTFTNDCPIVSFTRKIIEDPPKCYNRPELTFADVGPCLKDIVIGGTTESDIHVTEVQVSYDGGATFDPWDGNAIECNTTTVVRAMVFYCDICDPTCLEETIP